MSIAAFKPRDQVSMISRTRVVTPADDQRCGVSSSHARFPFDVEFDIHPTPYDKHAPLLICSIIDCIFLIQSPILTIPKRTRLLSSSRRSFSRPTTQKCQVHHDVSQISQEPCRIIYEGANSSLHKRYKLTLALSKSLGLQKGAFQSILLARCSTERTWQILSVTLHRSRASSPRRLWSRNMLLGGIDIHHSNPCSLHMRRCGYPVRMICSGFYV